MMNKSDAYKIDLEYARKYNENPFYFEDDYIWGLSSGFAYNSPIDLENEIKNMWDNMKKQLERNE